MLRGRRGVQRPGARRNRPSQRPRPDAPPPVAAALPGRGGPGPSVQMLRVFADRRAFFSASWRAAGSRRPRGLAVMTSAWRQRSVRRGLGDPGPLTASPLSPEPPKMSPVVEPLSWMLGTWLSDPPGAGTFPTLQPFQYLEEVHISHVGQPVLNFS